MKTFNNQGQPGLLDGFAKTCIDHCLSISDGDHFFVDKQNFGNGGTHGLLSLDMREYPKVLHFIITPSKAAVMQKEVSEHNYPAVFIYEKADKNEVISIDTNCQTYYTTPEGLESRLSAVKKCFDKKFKILFTFDEIHSTIQARSYRPALRELMGWKYAKHIYFSATVPMEFYSEVGVRVVNSTPQNITYRKCEVERKGFSRTCYNYMRDKIDQCSKGSLMLAVHDIKPILQLLKYADSVQKKYHIFHGTALKDCVQRISSILPVKQEDADFFIGTSAIIEAIDINVERPEAEVIIIRDSSMPHKDNYYKGFTDEQIMQAGGRYRKLIYSGQVNVSVLEKEGEFNYDKGVSNIALKNCKEKGYVKVEQGEKSGHTVYHTKDKELEKYGCKKVLLDEMLHKYLSKDTVAGRIEYYSMSKNKENYVHPYEIKNQFSLGDIEDLEPADYKVEWKKFNVKVTDNYEKVRNTFRVVDVPGKLKYGVIWTQCIILKYGDFKQPKPIHTIFGTVEFKCKDECLVEVTKTVDFEQIEEDLRVKFKKDQSYRRRLFLRLVNRLCGTDLKLEELKNIGKDKGLLTQAARAYKYAERLHEHGKADALDASTKTDVEAYDAFVQRREGVIDIPADIQIPIGVSVQMERENVDNLESYLSETFKNCFLDHDKVTQLAYKLMCEIEGFVLYRKNQNRYYNTAVRMTRFERSCVLDVLIKSENRVAYDFKSCTLTMLAAFRLDYPLSKGLDFYNAVGSRRAQAKLNINAFLNSTFKVDGDEILRRKKGVGFVDFEKYYDVMCNTLDPVFVKKFLLYAAMKSEIKGYPGYKLTLFSEVTKLENNCIKELIDRLKKEYFTIPVHDELIIIKKTEDQELPSIDDPLFYLEAFENSYFTHFNPFTLDVKNDSMRKEYSQNEFLNIVTDARKKL